MYLKRFVAGLLSKDKSLAVTLLIGLIAWTLVRLIDGIAASGTIEYATTIRRATLHDGRDGQLIEVRLENLSRDTAMKNLRVSVSDPTGRLEFGVHPSDRACSFQAPAWGENPLCDAYANGLSFAAPMLIPGTSARLAIKYAHRGKDAGAAPVVRIGPDGSTKVRLIEPGIETFLVRHETALLLTLLIVAAVLFIVGTAAGLSTSEEPVKGAQHAPD